MYFTCGTDKQIEIAMANLSKEDVELLDLRYELIQKRFRRKLEKMYDYCLAGIITSKQRARLGRRFDRIQRFIRNKYIRIVN